ncbi:MAG: endonuclease MutS2 [Candidatus Gastranaerophilales bacterium]|nr:endonuclease MutS2 [Candidatus Gastranaerophilales bacterium]
MKSVVEVTEFDKVKEYVSEFAMSEPARYRVLNAVLYDDIEDILREINYTTEARRLCDLNLKVPLENFADLTKSLTDAKRRIKLSAQEIWDIAELLRISRLVKSFLDKNQQEAPSLYEISAQLSVFKDFEDKVFDTFDSTLKVKENASAELKRLYQSLSDTLSNIKSTVSRLLTDTSFTDNLRDTIYTQRDGRTVFQVKAEAKNKILGIVHDVSASGQTFFIEPKELTELHNRQRETEILINLETDRILKSFSEEIGLHFDEISRNQDLIAEIDFHFAKGKYSQKTESNPSEISAEPKIVLQSMKNPVLMRVCDNVIENDFNAGKNNLCTIITGANTGGKTVVLKTIGLCVLMAKAGFHLPCTKAEIYPFKQVFADIGDQQNIIQSLSTFSSHIKNLIEMTEKADADTLVLIDEICSGTDPAEGSALARAVLQRFNEKETFSVVTTHFGDLKNLALNGNSFENASVRFDTETLKPTYRFVQGISGSSNAITIAENLGLNPEIIKNSREFFHETSGKNQERYAQIEQMWEDAAKKEEAAKNDAKIIEELKLQLEKQYEDLKKEKRKIIAEYKKQTQTAFDSARDEIKQVLKKLREDETRENAMMAVRKNSLIRKKIHDKLSEQDESLKEEYIDIDTENIKQGDLVIIRDLNQEAEFISFSDKGKKALILMGSVKTVIPVKKLAMYDKKIVKEKSKPLAKQKAPFEFIKRNISSTLDLRGFRYEEAMTELENYLDKACAARLPHAVIIHGHGTGVLKKAVREYLADSPYVAKFRPGEDAEGGDGVSVVDLS